ncbi:MBOAT family O-acyltransferase [Zobellia barbeyronii]|nr:MBOAT family O-acyltransferase [Zobellia barbeyronii]
MCWSPSYAILIFTSTVITYLSGVLIGKVNESELDFEKGKKKKKVYVAISLISNLSILFFFKYFYFIDDSLGDLTNLLGLTWQKSEYNILLPVGISFYTFQALGYTIDVYRNNLKPEKHFGIYALFVSFFPQLVAGPIERSTHLLPQFRETKKINWERIKGGLLLILWGFFQKVVIADRLAVLVNTVYNDPTNYEGVQFLLATVFFAFQILCDFSGYSDMAIGTAQVLGYDLMKNFDRPYFSKNLREFWRRWHISLSTWFRDYLYFPLGGNKVNKIKVYRNIAIVFLVSGLWHGANWTFVIWGALHGVYLIVEELIQPISNRLYNITKVDRNNFSFKFFHCVKTFAVVSFAWIFFRANNVGDAFYIIENLFVQNWSKLFGTELFSLGLDKEDFHLAVISILILLLVHWVQRKNSVRSWVKNQWLPLRWSVYLCFIFYIIIFGYYGSSEKAQFIYFQF